MLQLPEKRTRIHKSKHLRRKPVSDGPRKWSKHLWECPSCKLINIKHYIIGSTKHALYLCRTCKYEFEKPTPGQHIGFPSVAECPKCTYLNRGTPKKCILCNTFMAPPPKSRMWRSLSSETLTKYATPGHSPAPDYLGEWETLGYTVLESFSSVEAKGKEKVDEHEKTKEMPVLCMEDTVSCVFCVMRSPFDSTACMYCNPTISANCDIEQSGTISMDGTSYECRACSYFNDISNNVCDICGTKKNTGVDSILPNKQSARRRSTTITISNDVLLKDAESFYGQCEEGPSGEKSDFGLEDQRKTIVW